MILKVGANIETRNSVSDLWMIDCLEDESTPSTGLSVYRPESGTVGRDFMRSNKI
jgi:hypothetical protein